MLKEDEETPDAVLGSGALESGWTDGSEDCGLGWTSDITCFSAWIS